MPCEKQTTKKYLSRKSPPYSAMDCKGKTMDGKDGDVIDKYYSPVGNSDVPYPYAVGQKNSYFLIEKQYVENKNLDLKKDGVYTIVRVP
jgi:hypothetical protein